MFQTHIFVVFFIMCTYFNFTESFGGFERKKTILASALVRCLKKKYLKFDWVFILLPHLSVFVWVYKNLKTGGEKPFLYHFREHINWRYIVSKLYLKKNKNNNLISG